jgi:hypothetical protein
MLWKKLFREIELLLVRLFYVLMLATLLIKQVPNFKMASLHGVMALIANKCKAQPRHTSKYKARSKKDQTF